MIIIPSILVLVKSVVEITAYLLDHLELLESDLTEMLDLEALEDDLEAVSYGALHAVSRASTHVVWENVTCGSRHCVAYFTYAIKKKICCH